MARGRFITLEGGEGVGKSTLGRSLAERLREHGREVLLTREPGGAAGADAIRALLVQGDANRWSPLEEALLFATARLNHLRETIRPFLARGVWVICDRYYDSTRAYQIAGGGLAASVLDQLNALIGADTPDLTLILDLAVDVGLARSKGSELAEDRFEKKGEEFHRRVRSEFLALARREPDRCAVIDVSQPREQVLECALALIAERL
ncbi:MAG: dTMP kinase [Hyphomonadaceae bacterium]|nr:dTMP kinase [Hyphomonadaceae bacterium]